MIVHVSINPPAREWRTPGMPGEFAGAIKQLTIDVPYDVAERLAREPNVSAFITAAVRCHMMQESTRAILEKAGFTFTEEGLAEAKRELDEMHAKMKPELRAWARDFVARHAPHLLTELGDN